MCCYSQFTKAEIGSRGHWFARKSTLPIDSYFQGRAILTMETSFGPQSERF